MKSASGSRNGSGRRRIPRTTVNIAVFAPMPSASVRTATAVNTGARRRGASCLTLRRRGLHHAGNGMGQPLPPRAFGGELLPTGRREAVDADPLAVFRRFPGGGDQFLLGEAVKRRVE